MRPMQSKSSRMLVCRVVPVCCYRLVTRLAIGAKSGEGMIRICRCFEIAFMTAAALHGSHGKFILLLVDMTSVAIGDRM